MKKIWLLTCIMYFASCSTLNKIGIKPSAIETTLALKEILNSSTFRTIKRLKSYGDGDSEIMPSQLETVLSGLDALGIGVDMNEVKAQVSKASNLALNETEGIVTDAISEIKFKDAAAIVLGGEDAATGVLKNVMYTTVKKRYSTRLDEALQGQETAKYWPMAAGAYNMFAKEKVNGSLSDFLAERAVDALFLGIGRNEKAIRTDYKSLGSQVVNKVFDYYSKNKS